jgi:hypothetical protein
MIIIINTVYIRIKFIRTSFDLTLLYQNFLHGYLSNLLLINDNLLTNFFISWKYSKERLLKHEYCAHVTNTKKVICTRDKTIKFNRRYKVTIYFYSRATNIANMMIILISELIMSKFSKFRVGKLRNFWPALRR